MIVPMMTLPKFSQAIDHYSMRCSHPVVNAKKAPNLQRIPAAVTAHTWIFAFGMARSYNKANREKTKNE